MKYLNIYLFDGRAFSLQEKGGVSQIWAKILAHMLCEMKNEIILVLYNNHQKNIHLQELLANYSLELKTIVVDRLPSDSPRYDSEESRSEFRKLLESKMEQIPDVVINTYYGENIYPSVSKYVVVAHDFAHEELDLLRTKDTTKHVLKLKKEAFSAASHIVCISNTTHQKLNKYYSNLLSNKRVRVIYHGHDHLRSLRDHRSIKRDAPVVTYIGTRGGYKNFELVQNSYKTLIDAYPNIEINIVGGEAFSDNLRALLSGKNFKLFDCPSDGEINQLISQSDIYLSSSAYEGFGLPVLYSLYLKCTPMLSEIDVYKELASSHGFFVEWRNVTDVLEKIRFCLDPNRKNNGNYFRSWETVANQYCRFLD